MYHCRNFWINQYTPYYNGIKLKSLEELISVTMQKDEGGDI